MIHDVGAGSTGVRVATGRRFRGSLATLVLIAGLAGMAVVGRMVWGGPAGVSAGAEGGGALVAESASPSPADMLQTATPLASPTAAVLPTPSAATETLPPWLLDEDGDPVWWSFGDWAIEETLPPASGDSDTMCPNHEECPPDPFKP